MIYLRDFTGSSYRLPHNRRKTERRGDIMRVQFVDYTGGFPNLCRGVLTLLADGKEFVFPAGSLHSGGSVWFDDDWNEHVTDGDWEVTEWPPGFPEELYEEATDVINDNVPYGCCGGCV
jgi:hypothetical protein